MPWNNQGGGGPWGSGGGGGGPWGSGGGGGGRGNSPWGRGSGGGGSGPQGPDLEEMVRRGQERLKGLFPGGGGGRGLLLVAVVAVAIWFATGFYTVEPEEQGVVLRFGDFAETTNPGLNYHLPFPIERVIKVPVATVRRVEIGYRSPGDGGRAVGSRNVDDESLMLTGDENIIDVNFVVQWQVGNAADFAFNIRNPDSTVKNAAESAMREVIGQTKIAVALAEGRDQVALQAKEVLQTMLDEYGSGIVVTDLLLQRADPPQAVIDDYRDVQRARADQERLENEARAYANRIVPEARGQAEQIVQDARAYREQVVARAEGAAERFNSVYAAYEQAKDVTRKRMYLEMMEKVLNGMNKIIVEGAQEGNGVVPYLPLTEIQKQLGRDTGSRQ